MAPDRVARQHSRPLFTALARRQVRAAEYLGAQHCGVFIGDAANYLLFSLFQYARLGCPDELLAEVTALRRWRDDLALAFDGLGNPYLAYPASLA
jgi:hypothetical protein